MNFTREPIIETVITPREGYNLAIRNSKGSGCEDYFVDAVEVVSFGHSFFFRSQERPNSFLVPVSDYEILELKETRMVLKNVPSDRSIKIGGGRETPSSKSHREAGEPEQAFERSPSGSERVPTEQRKRDNKRRRGRRGGGGRPDLHPTEPRVPSDETADSVAPALENLGPEEAQKAPSFISKLFPPPTMLIKETLGRYKLPESGESHLISEEKVDELPLDSPAHFEIPLDPDEENSSEE